MTRRPGQGTEKGEKTGMVPTIPRDGKKYNEEGLMDPVHPSNLDEDFTYFKNDGHTKIPL